MFRLLNDNRIGVKSVIKIIVGGENTQSGGVICVKSGEKTRKTTKKDGKCLEKCDENDIFAN